MPRAAIVVLAVVVGAGLAISYLMYRQLGTETVMLKASPQFERTEQGALCGDVGFVVGARSRGRWLLGVEKGLTLSGVVAVDGNENLDIGFSIWSPTNRVVLSYSERAQRHEFEVAHTIRGEYRFEFDNRHSAFTDKRVKVSICQS